MNLRRIVILLHLVCHVAAALLKLSFFAPRWSETQRCKEIKRWSRRVFSILGIRLELSGEIAKSHGRGLLVVANHVSWLDVFAIMAVTDIRFVAKEEIRDWPVAGWLAARLGTQFIARDRRSDAWAAAGAVSELLDAGQTVCVFPEGTTTDGGSLRAFKPALFEAATRTACTVQPVALRYLDADGARSVTPAFTGETSLVESILTIASAAHLRCAVTLLPPIGDKAERRALAFATQDAIAMHLGLNVTAGPAAPIASCPDAVLTPSLA